MGLDISKFLGGDVEEDVKETVQILQKLVSAKLDAYAAEMEAKAFEDRSLPISAVVDRTEKYMVEVQEASSDEIKQTLGDLFKGKFLDGLHNLVTAALNELLGNAAAGEKEKRGFHVVYANNSLLRVDFHMYKYDFSSAGLKGKAENAFCYVIQTAVLDLQQLDPQVVLYELDKTIGSENIQENIQAATEKLQEEGKYMEELYKVIHRLRIAKGAGVEN